MGYSDPAVTHVPATSTIAPAAWGVAVNTAIEWLAADKARCRIYNNASISIPNAVDTAITFNTEDHDVGSVHSTSSNTSRATVPAGADGDWCWRGSVEFPANATGFRYGAITVGGVTQIALDMNLGTASAAVTCAPCSLLYPMVAGQYVELRAFQNSGGALNANFTSKYSPVLEGCWMGT